jgi:hypothetical protein
MPRLPRNELTVIQLKELAYAAYREMARELHGEFARFE